MEIELLKQYSETLAKKLVKALEKVNIKEVKGNGTFEVIATTEGVDRDGEIILVDGWDFENYMKNPIILWGHNYWDMNAVIGSATEIVKEDKRIIVKGIFANTEYGQQARQLYEDGILKTVSVGFIPRERTANVITKAELLELSFVSVPSNPDATSLSKLVKFSKNYKSAPEIEGTPNTSSNDATTQGNGEGDQEAIAKAKLQSLGKFIDDLSSIHDHYSEKIGVIELEAKSGRVLSSKNRDLVSKAIEALQVILDASEPEKTVVEASAKELQVNAQGLQKILEKVIKDAKFLTSNL